MKDCKTCGCELLPCEDGECNQCAETEDNPTTLDALRCSGDITNNEID